jgi:ankyrin repeat protein
MPRPSVPKNSHARLPRDNESVPLAPRLSDYMAPGGTIRYRPRPEWYLTRSKNRKNPPNADKEGVPKVAAAAFVDVDVVLEIPVVNDRGIEDASIAPAVAPNPNNPSLLVAPADGLLPEGAFQDYSVVVQEAAVGGEPEQPQPLCASNVPDQKQAANESKQGSCSRNHNNDDVLLADSTPPEPETTKPCFFGKDWDTALNLCIRENATEAALALLERGAPVDVENAKGITPIILSAQKGNYTVVRELLLRGANPGTSSTNGTTALLQAAHFGHGSVVELLLLKGSLGLGLINHCNYNHTTPLMRASQEGHLKICRCLLSSGAQVNRQNRVQMTALMLAAQRGHAEICQLLIDYGAELDAMTASQQSTSLLLACKRGNVEVVRVLVTAGCELWIRDSKGRTAREIARRREHKELADLLDETMQVDMMQRQGRRERSVEVVRLWNLLQQERAKIEIEENEMVSIHQINSILEGRSLPFQLTLTSTRALLQTMTLPFPLVESIAQYLPLPHLWSKRMGMVSPVGGSFRHALAAALTLTLTLTLVALMNSFV